MQRRPSSNRPISLSTVRDALKEMQEGPLGEQLLSLSDCFDSNSQIEDLRSNAHMHECLEQLRPRHTYARQAVGHKGQHGQHTAQLQTSIAARGYNSLLVALRSIRSHRLLTALHRWRLAMQDICAVFEAFRLRHELRKVAYQRAVAQVQIALVRRQRNRVSARLRDGQKYGYGLPVDLRILAEELSVEETLCAKFAAERTFVLGDFATMVPSLSSARAVRRRPSASAEVMAAALGVDVDQVSAAHLADRIRELEMFQEVAMT